MTVTKERLRELEWAATFVKETPAPERCRCAGTCDRCRQYNDAWAKLSPEAVLALITEVRRIRTDYTMVCASCGYVRAKHPLHPRDCAGFKESETFR